MKFEASKGSDKTTTMTYSEISSLMLSEGFMSLLKRLKIGEELFNYDVMTNFKRIE